MGYKDDACNHQSLFFDGESESSFWKGMNCRKASLLRSYRDTEKCFPELLGVFNSLEKYSSNWIISQSNYIYRPSRGKKNQNSSVKPPSSLSSPAFMLQASTPQKKKSSQPQPRPQQPPPPPTAPTLPTNRPRHLTSADGDHTVVGPSRGEDFEAKISQRGDVFSAT